MSQKTRRPVSEILELAPIIARVEEARTVGNLPPLNYDPDAESHELLKVLCMRLADDLEANSRRLIQTSVQLLGLREAAASAVAMPSNPEGVTGHIASYLSKAFGFEQVLLLGADSEGGVLQGTWVTENDGRTLSLPLRIPMNEHDSVIVSVFYSDTPSLVNSPDSFPLFAGAQVPPELPVERIGSYALVPLVGGRGAPGAAASGEADATGGVVEGAKAVGVLGIITSPSNRVLGPDDLNHLESIGPGVAGALETALLTMDLRRNERFTASVLDSMNSGLVAVDLEGRVMIFNRMAEKLTGYSAEEALGANLDGLLPEVGGTSHVLDTLRRGRGYTRVETSIRVRDEQELPVSLATFLIIGEDSQPIGAVATFVDLTPLRRMEEKVRQLDRLATLGKFTSAVAHEIRNPLAGIAAGAQYIGKSLPESDPQQENLRFVLEEIARLNRIISDLFNITHPQQPLLQPQKIEPIFERSLKTVGELARVAGSKIEVDVEEGMPEVELDADQMEQVLINLIKNGLEAAGQGGVVRVSARHEERGLGGDGAAGEPCLVVTVWDSGPGISDEDQGRIFEPFYSTKDGGTGLGLYVSKGIVERHGGTITVGTGRGGSAFTLVLPLQAPTEEDWRR
jgi:two-component system nitrogen regulation sensor histidine kinase GlnL